MRYAKAEALLHLAHAMQGTAEGLTLDDIANRFEVSRRTAERMRDAVMRVFPQVEEVSLGDGYKRWRMVARRGYNDLTITADQLAVLHTAIARLRQDGLGEDAVQLEAVEATLRSLMQPRVLSRVEPDYDLLVQAEGLALRPGPRPQIDPRMIRDLRTAIKGSRQLRITYTARFTGTTSEQVVHPYGILYGNRHYLVAVNPGAGKRRLYSLSNIEELAVLAASFERDPAFTLDEFAARSFGVYQEEPVQVVWRVKPDSAADARAFLFHPTQTLDEQTDGSLLVRFRAGGLLEMCWHVFTWGGDIEILEPPPLVEMMRKMLSAF